MVEESSVDLATSDIRNMIAHIACIVRGTSFFQLPPVPLSNSVHRPSNEEVPGCSDFPEQARSKDGFPSYPQVLDKRI
jgi:hypothetical protein